MRLTSFPTKNCVIRNQKGQYKGRSDRTWHDSFKDAPVFTASAVQHKCKRNGWERVPVTVSEYRGEEL